MEEAHPTHTPVHTSSPNTTGPTMRPMTPKRGSSKGFNGMVVLIFFAVLIVVGSGAGYILAQNKAGGGILPTTQSGKSDGSIQKGQVYGTNDSIFKDKAEGVLKEGGVEGEGAFHLERPGGESQNVYLTSYIVDLAKFENRKVKVWGQTNTAQTAGWLMNVGKLQVLE